MDHTRNVNEISAKTTSRMNDSAWRSTLKEGAVAGTVASLTSTLVLVQRGHMDCDNAAAPINGPSQWVWGTDAAYENRGTLRHTLIGYLIHHAMSIFWGTVYA